MTSHVEITLAEPDDFAAIRSLLAAYQRWLDLDLSYQHFAEEVAHLPGAYGDPEGALLIAHLDDQPVGMAALRRLDNERCEMKRLFVRTEARGLGIGKRLAERIISEARVRGYREMVLDTLPVMTDAQRMYSELGFVDIAPYYDSPIAGTRFMSLVL